MRDASPKRRHNAQVVGDHGPWVVLAPGFGTTQAAWRHVVPRLRDRFRVLLFDPVGFAPDQAEHYDHARYATLDAYAEDVERLLRVMGIGSCGFVGHSLSGMTGLLLAERAPGLFDRLVLLASSACYLDKDGYRGGFSRDGKEAFLDAIIRDYKAWIADLAPRMTARPPDDGKAREFADCLRAMRSDTAFSIALMVFQTDLRDRLHRLRVPCTILQTRDDPAIPLEAARFLHARLPDSVLEILDTEGHLPHLTAPDLVADALLRHLGTGGKG